MVITFIITPFIFGPLDDGSRPQICGSGLIATRVHGILPRRVAITARERDEPLDRHSDFLPGR
jgi:hypothetical protein